VAAAKAAGMACVGFPSTGRTREDVAKADLVISALGDLTPETFRALIERSAGSR
jgi:beta-phosphoglucomutase-like phosphatase (HAD superfamily)